MCIEAAHEKLLYNIVSAPGIFQHMTEMLLQGIPQVVVRINNIFGAGKTRDNHL